MQNWYTSETGNHQGLVINESDGRNVAVVDDRADATLIAAAPRMRAILKVIESDDSAMALLQRLTDSTGAHICGEIRAVISETVPMKLES